VRSELREREFDNDLRFFVHALRGAHARKRDV
jgi:hypothetical protein